MRASRWLCCVLVLAGCDAGQGRSRAGTLLPLRALRLYETGTGYFERRGTVVDDTALPVPAGHLDDALKTLVVLGKDGKAAVQGVEFASSVSRGMARGMAGLPLDADAPITHRDLLGSLKGAPVVVEVAGGRFAGRLVDVLEPEAAAGEKGEKGAEGEPTLLLLTDGGEVRRFAGREVRAVRATDPLLVGRLRSALDSLSARGAQALRRLQVMARSAEPVTIGYVTETPVWRTTYRMVFDAPGQPGVLQAWALVHNDTDEDWQEVTVHLVNGKPDSFLFPLAAPRYARREVVAPRQELSTVPQLMDTTVDSLYGDQIGDAEGVGGLGLHGTGRGGGGSGEGTIGLGRMGTIGRGGGGGAEGESSALSVGNLAAVAEAKGVEAGALFTYTMADRLSLRAHGSALMPFLQQRIEAREVTLVDAAGATARSGLRLVNTTRQTLPDGPIAVFAGGGFAGEAQLDRLKPGERRFLAHGVDLDVEVRPAGGTSDEETQRLTYRGEVLEEHFLRRGERRYEVENRGGQRRDVYLTLALRPNATVTGADELDYDTVAGTPLAVLRADGRARAVRTLKTEEGLSRRFDDEQVSAEVLGRLAGLASLPAAQREIAREAAAAQARREETRAAMVKSKEELAGVEADLGRLREHLKAAGDRGAGGASPFVARILAAEDRLAALKKRGETLAAELRAEAQAVHRVLSRLPSPK